MANTQDAQWMSTTFDEAIINCEVMALLTPHIIQTKNLSGIVGSDLSFMIKHYLQLETHYNETLKNFPKTHNDDMLTEKNTNHDNLVDDLTDSFRVICRSFRLSPAMLQNFCRHENISKLEWVSMLTYLVEYFQIMKRKMTALCSDDDSNLTFQINELETTVDEAKQKHKEIKNILLTEKRENSLDMAQKSAKVKKLCEEIESFRTEVRLKSIDIATYRKVELKRQQDRHSELADKLDAEYVELEAKSQLFQQDSVEKELKSRKNLRRLESEIAESLYTFDTKMLALSATHERVKSVIEHDNAILSDLNTQVDELVTKRERFEWKVAEKKRIKEEVRVKQDNAARIIQRNVRQWKTRKDANQKSKSKSKGKNAKKGGKKKKK